MIQFKFNLNHHIKMPNSIKSDTLVTSQPGDIYLTGQPMLPPFFKLAFKKYHTFTYQPLNENVSEIKDIYLAGQPILPPMVNFPYIKHLPLNENTQPLNAMGQSYKVTIPKMGNILEKFFPEVENNKNENVKYKETCDMCQYYHVLGEKCPSTKEEIIKNISENESEYERERERERECESSHITGGIRIKLPSIV